MSEGSASGAPVGDGTLNGVLDKRSLKWIFVGGKGGVGKTTVSCALATLLTQERSSVLLVSTDPAHNLSDAFNQKFHSEPSLVKGFSNLFAMEVDGSGSSSTASSLLPKSGFVRQLTESFPGMDELGGLMSLMQQVEMMDFDVIVFDTAPTGHTLRLLNFPSSGMNSVGKLLGMEGMMPMMNKLAGSLMGLNESDETMSGQFDKTCKVLDQVAEHFRDPEHTTFVAVCIPEFLSLYETERLIQELFKNDIDCQNIVVNQLLYTEEGDKSRVLEARLGIQRKYLRQMQELYHEDFNVVHVPLALGEVRGADKIREFAESLLVRAPQLETIMERLDEGEEEEEGEERSGGGGGGGGFNK